MPYRVTGVSAEGGQGFRLSLPNFQNTTKYILIPLYWFYVNFAAAEIEGVIMKSTSRPSKPGLNNSWEHIANRPWIFIEISHCYQFCATSTQYAREAKGKGLKNTDANQSAGSKRPFSKPCKYQPNCPAELLAGNDPIQLEFLLKGRAEKIKRLLVVFFARNRQQLKTQQRNPLPIPKQWKGLFFRRSIQLFFRFLFVEHAASP